MFKSNCTQHSKTAAIFIQYYTSSEHTWNRYWPKLTTSFSSFCIMQQLWYQSATTILNILTNFAEFAVATMVIPIVKRQCRNKWLSNPNVPYIQTFFIFLTSIIYISVNNLVLISSLSPEKESLFWITRQLTLKAGLIYADFSYHFSPVPQNVFLVTFMSGLCSTPWSILTVTDFMLIQSLLFSFRLYIYLYNCF